ncbi:hypothetical protein ABTH55_18680, partial [Acinetobacter baumannii]
MRSHRPLLQVVIAAAFVVPSLGAGEARAANLFDALGALFGVEPEPRPAPGAGVRDGHGALDITVRPRR